VRALQNTSLRLPESSSSAGKERRRRETMDGFGLSMEAWKHAIIRDLSARVSDKFVEHVVIYAFEYYLRL